MRSPRAARAGGGAAFRASGNLVFEAKSEPASRLAERIEKALGTALGFEVVTFVRTAAEVRAIVAREPFPAAQLQASKGKLQIAFLARKPSAKARREVLSLSTAGDRLAISGRELYWLPKGGTQTSELDLKLVESALGVSTMRTKGTVEQIAAKHFGA